MQSLPFLNVVQNRFTFQLFMLQKLPSAFFSGVRVADIGPDACMVTVPYKWFSQNPFQSTYFACLAMAAEMSTGLLAMMYTYEVQPAVSMLVQKLEAEYFKKATGITTFTCQDGAAFRSVVEAAIQTGEAQTYTATSMGVNAAGETVAVFYITWTFKQKTKK
jgi:hypothetical protein